MAATINRTANYDSIAAEYDRRYDVHAYAGVADALTAFLTTGSPAAAIVEVGCGTGHWLALLEARVEPSPLEELTPSTGVGTSTTQNWSAKASAGVETSTTWNWSPTGSAVRRILAGVEPSAQMIGRARASAPGARLVRARAEALPWRDATFDRVYCVNALHHFTDRAEFFAEARRILRPGGGLLTIGKDPHADRDAWWVYDYFPETREIDRRRFAPVRVLRGELARAGFAWAESCEVDRIEAITLAREALASGIVDRAYTSQLAVLSDEELSAGVDRIRQADRDADGQLDLVTDFRLYGTIGWVV
jgi:ubiquinone/menaquinone biosynthesis C-methylase UbiE